jgi:hypothetical protein
VKRSSVITIHSLPTSISPLGVITDSGRYIGNTAAGLLGFDCLTAANNTLSESLKYIYTDS